MGALKGVVIFMGFLIVTVMGLMIYGFYQKSQDSDFKFFADDTPPAKTVQSNPADTPTPVGTSVNSSAIPSAFNAIGFGEVSLNLRPGARVLSTSVSADRLILVIARDGQNADLVAVIDVNTGKILGRVITSP